MTWALKQWPASDWVFYLSNFITFPFSLRIYYSTNLRDYARPLCPRRSQPIQKGLPSRFIWGVVLLKLELKHLLLQEPPLACLNTDHLPTPSNWALWISNLITSNFLYLKSRLAAMLPLASCPKRPRHDNSVKLKALTSPCSYFPRPADN